MVSGTTRFNQNTEVAHVILTRLLSLSDAELAEVDPVEMNLLVAKSIPSLAGRDIGHY
jgi:hypothetical protein